MIVVEFCNFNIHNREFLLVSMMHVAHYYCDDFSSPFGVRNYRADSPSGEFWHGSKSNKFSPLILGETSLLAVKQRRVGSYFQSVQFYM